METLSCKEKMIRAAFTRIVEFFWGWYEYFAGRCREKEPIPLDAREKIYERDVETLNRILYYYKMPLKGKK